MSIQVINNVTESLKNFFEHKVSWLRVAFAPLVIYFFCLCLLIISGTLVTPPLPGQGLSIGFLPLFLLSWSIILIILSMGILNINTLRYGILNEGGDTWWHLDLDKRLAKIILYTILLLIGFMGFALVGVGVVVAIHFLFHSAFLDVILGIAYGVMMLYVFTRLALVYPLIAIDREKPLTTSWAMLNGNVWRYLGMILLISLIMFGISFIGGFIIGSITGIVKVFNPFMGKFLYIILQLPFSLMMLFFQVSVLAKATSLVYLSLMAGEQNILEKGEDIDNK